MPKGTRGVERHTVSHLLDEIEELRSLFQQSQEFAKAWTPTYLMVPSQKKIPSFSAQTDVKLEDWIYDIQTATKVRPLSKQAEIDFALQYLAGPAREEVKYHDINTLKKLIMVLREAFGDQGSSVQIQRSFIERKQMPGESLRDFSHSLLEIDFALQYLAGPAREEVKYHDINTLKIFLTRF